MDAAAPRLLLFCTCTMPALTRVWPVYVLAPARISVPEPDLIRLPTVPGAVVKTPSKTVDGVGALIVTLLLIPARRPVPLKYSGLLPAIVRAALLSVSGFDTSKPLASDVWSVPLVTFRLPVAAVPRAAVLPSVRVPPVRLKAFTPGVVLAIETRFGGAGLMLEARLGAVRDQK